MDQVHRNSTRENLQKSFPVQQQTQVTTMPSDQQKTHNIETCVLNVNVDCHGCRQKVKKILKKIEGVYTVNIDADQQCVIVRGIVDTATLIKKLHRSGKHAEVWSPKSQLQDISKDKHHLRKNKNRNSMNYQTNSSRGVPSIDQLIHTNLHDGRGFQDGWGYEGDLDQGMDLEEGEMENFLMDLSRNRSTGTGNYQANINDMIQMMGIQGHADHQGYDGGASVGSGRNNLERFQNYSTGSPAYGYQQPSPLMMANLLGAQYNQNPYAALLRTNPQAMQAMMNNRVHEGYVPMQHQY